MDIDEPYDSASALYIRSNGQRDPRSPSLAATIGFGLLEINGPVNGVFYVTASGLCERAPFQFNRFVPSVMLECSIHMGLQIHFKSLLLIREIV